MALTAEAAAPPEEGNVDTSHLPARWAMFAIASGLRDALESVKIP